MSGVKTCPLSNDEIVEKILNIGEMLSDVTLLPYQLPFARRVVKNVIEKNVKTITALFSRQCLEGTSLIWTPSGMRQIKDISPGDYVYAFDGKKLVRDRVTDCWETPAMPRYRIKVEKTAASLVMSSNHRFFSTDEGKWKAISSGLKSNEHLLAPLFSVMSEDEEHRQEDATKAIHLIYKKFQPGELMKDVMSESIHIRLGHSKQVSKLNKILGGDLEFSEAPRYFEAHVPAQRFESYHSILRNTKLLFEILMMDATLAPFMDNYGHKRYKIKIPISSSIRERLELKNIMRLCGLDPKQTKNNFVLEDFQSIYILSPFINHLLGAEDVWKYLHSYKNWYGSYVSGEHLCAVIKKLPQLEKYILTRRTRSSYMKYRRDGLLLATFLEFVRGVAPELEESLLPATMGRRIRSFEKYGYGDLYDIETEKTGNYISEGLINHNSGKSEALSVVIIGLMLFLPALAAEYFNDTRFTRFRKGFWVGVFAPVLRQAKTVFTRVRRRLKSENGEEMMYKLGIDFVVDQAVLLELTNGSKLGAYPGDDEANIEAETFHLVVGDEAQDISGFKWKKSIVPMTTMTAGAKVMIGTANTKRSYFFESIEKNKKESPEYHFQVDHAVVSNYVPEYKLSVMEVIAEQGAESDEFLMAYCNKFIFERGMMLDPKFLELRTADTPRGMFIESLNTVDVYTGDLPVVVGIDVGKKLDSTVLTAIEVLTDNPIDVMGSRYYPLRVIGWMEMLGDTLDEQVSQMIMFINAMKAQKVVIDSTGKGDNFYEKLSLALPNKNVTPFVFSSPSKSELFKNYISTVVTGRLLVPADPELRKTKMWRRFAIQNSEMEKEYRNQYLVCNAPKRKNAHDDYVDSIALAVWGAKAFELQPTFVVANNFFKKHKRSPRRGGR